MKLMELAATLAAVPLALELHTHEALEKACVMFEESAKGAIGTYEFGWTQLKASTQRQRVSLGFSANEPLLRSGELQRSIEHQIHGHDGYVGTNDPIAIYQECGTSRIPPRPFMGGALAHNEHKLEDLWGVVVAASFGGSV